MTKLMAISVISAVVCASVTGQEGKYDAAQPTVLTGWLNELLDGDTAAAVRSYQRTMARPELDNRARVAALRRGLEIARAQGDRQAVERLLAPTTTASRESALGRYRDQMPGDSAALRRAVLAGDSVATARARASFVTEAQQDRNLSLWVGNTQPMLIAKPPSGAAGTPEASTTRLRVALPPVELPGLVRQRIALIASLRLRGPAEDADRLESDLIARSGNGRRRARLTIEQATSGPSTDDAIVADGRERLQQALASDWLLRIERQVLTEADARLELLVAASRSPEAVQLLRSLPYAVVDGP